MSAKWTADRAEIEAAYADRARLDRPAVRAAVERVLAALDAGELRVAEPSGGADGDAGASGWTVHAWVKEAILLYFALRPAEAFEVGPFAYRDKIPLKRDPERRASAWSPRPSSATAPFSSAGSWPCRPTSTSAPGSARAR